MLTTALVCLAMNVYHEARSQSTAGQIAVAQVVINRVNDSRYPDNVCDVVTQGVMHNPTDSVAWSNAILVALTVHDGMTVDMLEGATHYHATSVQPDWAVTKTRTARIDDHIFYRWEK